MKFTTKKAIRNTIGNVTSLFLKSIYFTCEVMDCFTISRSDLWNSINGTNFGKEWSRDKFTHSLHNLEKSGYVRFKNDEGCSIEFTNKAKLKIIDNIASEITPDAHFRFVSFDIPEGMRTQRDKFRRTIKKLGFKQIQKSLWVINKNVGDLVELAAYEYGVEKYIVYIAADATDIDGILIKKFD